MSYICPKSGALLNNADEVRTCQAICHSGDKCPYSDGYIGWLLKQGDERLEREVTEKYNTFLNNRKHLIDQQNTPYKLTEDDERQLIKIMQRIRPTTKPLPSIKLNKQPSKKKGNVAILIITILFLIGLTYLLINYGMNY